MQFLEEKKLSDEKTEKMSNRDAAGFNNQLLELKLLDMSGKWYSVLRSETVKIINSFNTVLDQLNKTYSTCMFKLTNNEK